MKTRSRTPIAHMILTATTVVLAVTVITACDPGLSAEDGITYLEEPVDVYEEAADTPEATVRASGDASARGKGPKVENFEFVITRVANALPVQVDSSTVQANDVIIVADHAIVAYNTAGNTFAGAIQIISLATPTRPVITAELAFPNVDINTLAVSDAEADLFDDLTLYFGGAIEPGVGHQTERAFVGSIDLGLLSEISRREAGSFITETIDAAAALSTTSTTYYVTTGVAVFDGSVYAAAGADPGVVVSLSADLGTEGARLSTVEGETTSANLYDIRDIEPFRGGLVAIAGTQGAGAPDDARIMVIRDAGGSFSIHDRSTQTIADFGSQDAKATLEIYRGRYAFLGLSEAGFKVYYLHDVSDDEATTDPIFSIGNPTVGWSTKTATNSASYAGSLIFTANGEAGFRVFRLNPDERTRLRDAGREPRGRGRPLDAQLVGFVPFDGTDSDGDGVYWSANHIEFVYDQSSRKGTLVVASGSGGVNFYTITAVAAE